MNGIKPLLDNNGSFQMKWSKPVFRVRMLLVFGLISVFGIGNAQNDSLILPIMQRGMELTEEGKYDLALMEFQRALAIKPKSGFVNFEIAHAHYQLGNKSKALDYANTARKEDSEYGLQAFILQGSVYDELGKYRKSIRSYEKGIKRFGDYYLLHYNLGVTALDHQEFERASEAFQAAILNKLDHADSHFALAKSKSAQGKRVEAIYPLYFYLLLNPNSAYTVSILESIKKLQGQGVELVGGDSNKLKSTGTEAYGRKDRMRSAEMLFSMFESSRYLERYSDQSKFEVEAKLLASFFTRINDLSFDEENLYTQYYIPFFSAIATSDYYLVFSHYIHQKADTKSEQWVKDHFTELEGFFTWLDEEAPTLEIGQETRIEKEDLNTNNN